VRPSGAGAFRAKARLAIRLASSLRLRRFARESAARHSARR
jgi:hypothetical protein